MNQDLKKVKFLELLEPINDKLYMYAKALEKNTDDAKDLVADTILACWENFDKINDFKLFKSYVFQVARNKFRRKKRRVSIFGFYDEIKAMNIPNNDSSPDLPTDVAILYEALNELPEKQKEALVLFEISGFSIEEIKKIQGGSISGVKSRLTRGRLALKEKLTKEISFDETKNNRFISINENLEKALK